MTRSDEIDRRALVAGGLSLGLGLALAAPDAHATQGGVDAVLKKLTGGNTPQSGRISIDLPPITESGNSVPLTFDVQSPMSADDRVRSVHVLADGNPNPEVAVFHFGPAMPRATGQLRIRLAQSQNVVVVALMANGEAFVARREVKVTIGGCAG